MWRRSGRTAYLALISMAVGAAIYAPLSRLGGMPWRAGAAIGALGGVSLLWFAMWSHEQLKKR
jgi:hypothetical protein